MSRVDHVRWRDDQIFAFLREHPLSTTQEVAKAVTPGCTHSTTCCHYSPVYSRLRTLAKRGKVTWQGWGEGPDPQVTTWRLAEPQPAAAEQLEQIWALPALDPSNEDYGHGC